MVDVKGILKDYLFDAATSFQNLISQYQNKNRPFFRFLQVFSMAFFALFTCGMVKLILRSFEQEAGLSTQFPSSEWLQSLEIKLNSDEKYAQIAKKWEGDLFFFIEPEGTLKEELTFYLDLWHGTCRSVDYNPNPEKYSNPVFTLRATYNNIMAILTGKLDPMAAMMTNKLKVKGNLGYMMRNVPTVLDFVRCAREITTDIL
jgi:putative sterol carrier protein